MGLRKWLLGGVFAAVAGGYAYTRASIAARDDWAVRQLDRGENIATLEKCIVDEQQRLFSMVIDGKFRDRPVASDPYEMLVPYFRDNVRPVLAELLPLPETEPSYHIGRDARRTTPGALLLYGLFGTAVLLALWHAGQEWQKYAKGDFSLKSKARIIAMSMVHIALLSWIGFDQVPKVGEMRNYFVPKLGAVHVEDVGGQSREDLAMTLVHEYTHYAEDSHSMPFSRVLWEGLANRTAMRTAQRLFDRTGDASFLKGIVWEDLDHLRDVYMVLCRSHGARPASNIEALWDREIDIHDYAVGASLLRVWEDRYGEGIYEKVLRDDFSFLPRENRPEQ